MKFKFSYVIFLLIVTFFTTAALQIAEECDVSTLKSELKRELRPDFRYDSSKSTRFTYKAKQQVKEIEVPLFMGEKYRFLFNTTGLPKGIAVKIYNKKSSNKNRKILYSLEAKEGQDIYAFEPKKSRKMYINYIIPESSETELRGCVIFVLGYKISIL